MIKKNIIKVSAMLMVLSSLSLAATVEPQVTSVNAVTQTKGYSEENKKHNNQIYSKYEDKFNTLDVSLLEKRQDLRKELRAENVNWKKVESITKDKANLQAQKEVLGYQLKDELSKNNLRPMRMSEKRHDFKNGPNRPMNPNERGFAPKK